MRVSQISYERLVNTGNYSHEKYGITVDLDEDEQPQQALTKAKALVEKQLHAPTLHDREICGNVQIWDMDNIF